MTAERKDSRPLVLDSSVFFTHTLVYGEAYTTPMVVAELRDLSSKGRFEALLAVGLGVSEAKPESVSHVRKAAEKTGDIPVLSETDIGILALALDVSGEIVTDDYAIQNTAAELQIPVRPVQMRRAKPRRWKYRCAGCGRYYDAAGTCEVCGAEIKRKLK